MKDATNKIGGDPAVKEITAKTNDTVKVQFELPADRVKEIEAMMNLTGVSTRKDYFNNALTLLQWAIRERYMGNTIASVDEKKKRLKELVMPILDNAAHTAK